MKKEMKKISNQMKQLSNEMKEMRTEFEQQKNEMKRMRDEVQSLTDRCMPTQENISSFRNIFAQSYLDGLRELANESLSGIVKLVWCSILFVSLILLTYQITGIAKDYVEEITVTQIGQIETNLTELNRPSICFTIFPDFLYKRDDRGTVDDLEPLDNDSLLYLGYIKAMVPHFASSGLWLSHAPSENITWSQFQSLGARSWLSMSQENASYLSQNTLYDSLFHWGIGQISAPDDSVSLSIWHPTIHSKLSHATNFYSDVLSRVPLLNGSLHYYTDRSWICVPIDLSTNSSVSPSGERIPWFSYGHYYGEPANWNILEEMIFSVIDFNAKHYPLDFLYAMSFFEADSVYRQDTVGYTLIPTKFQHRNLSRRKCYDAKGEIYPRGYGETICFHDCLWESHARLFNCSFWEDFDDHPSMKVCHTFDIFDQVRSHMTETCLSDGDQGWCNNETSKSVDEWNGLILQTYRDKVINEAYLSGCKQKCADWTFCDEWELEYGLLYKHETVKETKSGLNWTGNEMYREYTVSNFISVNKEVLKVSLEEFMASLGGTIGLYFGFSICGCLHLLLFLSIYSFGKVINLWKRRHLQVTNNQMSTTDNTDHHSRNIGMIEIE